MLRGTVSSTLPTHPHANQEKEEEEEEEEEVYISCG